jgi:hypothetical protein
MTHVITGVLAVLGLSLLADAAPLELHWQKVQDKDGISVYRSNAPGTAVVAFKGEGKVDAPLLKVAHVIIDPARGTEWVDSLAESRVLRPISPFEFLEYDRFSMPLLVKDRDLVTRVTVEPDAAARRVIVRFVSVEAPEAPPAAGCVRAQLVHSLFELHEESAAVTLVKAEILCDPRGSLPKWLVNYFQKSWPVTTLEALRRQSVRPDVTEHAALGAAMGRRDAGVSGR